MLDIGNITKGIGVRVLYHPELDDYVLWPGRIIAVVLAHYLLETIAIEIAREPPHEEIEVAGSVVVEVGPT